MNIFLQVGKKESNKITHEEKLLLRKVENWSGS